jgi:hypothetical protein
MLRAQALSDDGITVTYTNRKNELHTAPKSSVFCYMRNLRHFPFVCIMVSDQLITKNDHFRIRTLKYDGYGAIPFSAI